MDNITDAPEQNTYSEKHSHPLDDASTRSPASTAHSDLIKEALYPEDSYVGDVYWADLPRSERITWVNAQSNAETKREAKVVWEMFKKDPLEPLRQYFRKYVSNGMGLFVEGELLSFEPRRRVELTFSQPSPSAFRLRPLLYRKLVRSLQVCMARVLQNPRRL